MDKQDDVEVMRQALESQDFYEMCQQYRHSLMGYDEFEALKAWILDHLPARQSL